MRKFGYLKIFIIICLIIGLCGCDEKKENPAEETVQSVTDEQGTAEELDGDQDPIVIINEPNESDLANEDQDEAVLADNEPAEDEQSASEEGRDEAGDNTDTDKAEWVVANDTANIRKEPSTNAGILRKLNIGEKLELVSKGEEWSEVRIDGTSYYVHNEYLDKSDGSMADKTQEDDQDNTEDTAKTEDTDSAVAGVKANTGSGRLIAIDAGHQSKGNSGKEPLGPGSSQMKAKVTGGTTGRTTGQTEYDLNLKVAQKLKAELTARGYQVLMIRESNDVNISNAERAQMANNAGAAAFIRIHANGSDNTSVSGVMTICQTSSNPYNAALHDASKLLSTAVLDGVVANTGAKRQKVWETDTMTGINWCQTPVTIIEMGYLTNPNEDMLMATDDYQNKIARGIADGIDVYMGSR